MVSLLGLLEDFRYLIHKDIADVVEFFSSKMFPIGCNSSFIALNCNVKNANNVIDFRHISDIWYLYNSVGNILANMMCFVIDILFSVEQSSFIKGSQILRWSSYYE